MRVVITDEAIGGQVASTLATAGLVVSESLCVPADQLSDSLTLLGARHEPVLVIADAAFEDELPGFGLAVRAEAGFVQSIRWRLACFVRNKAEVYVVPLAALSAVALVLTQMRTRVVPAQSADGLDGQPVNAPTDSTAPDPALASVVLSRSDGVSLAVTSGDEGAFSLPEGGLCLSGWKAAVASLGGELDQERREALPWEVEKLAPFVDVLNQAGQRAVLKLPNGKQMGLYGFPDLIRDGSKVLAVGYGEPLCEVLALHRFPVATGVWVDGGGASWVQGMDAAEMCREVTKRSFAATGDVFASDGEKVWFVKERTVYSFDGSKERNEGTAKSVLASLVLRWSNR